MSIRTKNKDHLKEHGGIELVESTLAPASDDPLRFWTNHPTENSLIDLRVFADGEYKNPNPSGGGNWSGPFSGRPELITELALALQARLAMATKPTGRGYIAALRAFWRVFDQLESTTTPDGRAVERLTSVKNLTHLHEAAAHRAVIDSQRFVRFVVLVDDVRRLMRLGPLAWTTPSYGEPNRQLVPDDQSKALRIAIKRDWERVRNTWARHEAIMLGEEPDTLSEFEKQDAAIVRQYVEQNDELRRNWQHLDRLQKITGRILPTAEHLCEGVSNLNAYTGLELSLMRAIAYPTREEADIAFHMALAGSGWNSSTLITGIDATLPDRVFQHPKDANQSVLVIDAPENKDEDMEDVTMQGSKRRAGGRLQFCMGLKKNPDSPPNIVAAYLKRTVGLRDQLRQDIKETQAELTQLKSDKAPTAAIERHFKLLQTLQEGLRNVWIYVDGQAKINWLDGNRWTVYRRNGRMGGRFAYLDLVIDRHNVDRAVLGKPPVARIKPSDFRDIYARWVHIQTGGNVIAVMLALGHASLRSTNRYLDNNVFNAVNDETAHRFMTRLFQELEKGRVDLTILAQLVRHGDLTAEMQERLAEYRRLMRSRVKAGCSDPKHPPTRISPDHVEGKWCGTQRCLRDCPNAHFMPESVDGIAMRVEELMAMSDDLPVETWLQGEFEKELESGEYLLAELYPQVEVDKARTHWREKIHSGKHVIPGIGLIRNIAAA